MMQVLARGLIGYWKTSLADLPDSWDRGCRAASLMHAGSNLPGIILRARPGAVRDAFLARLPMSTGRIHPSMTDEALLGGIDISATLSAGKVMKTRGLIQPNAILTITMAERLTPHMAALLAQALDSVPGLQLILLDEGANSDEQVPDVLLERLPFYVDLDDVQYSDLPAQITQNTPRAPAGFSDDDLTLIANLAHDLGVDSARAPFFTLRTAQWLAAGEGRAEVTTDDLSQAASLTLSHRATQLPQPEAEPEPQDPDPSEAQSEAPQNDSDDHVTLPEELVLEAVLATLPRDLLQRLADPKSAGMSGSGSGAKRVGNRRGRPLPSRKTTRISGQTLDLYATMRTAVPWQPMRQRESQRSGLHIRSTDLHVKRFEDSSDRLIIFAVDASGSAAISRLGEAKGAIELLLGEAYARRDHVALVSFRGAEAEVLLPPTRSLVQTKRRLAALPGGGGTPLAAGLETALHMAITAQRRGMSPKVCILTDGRANVDRAGNADRAQAMEDAETLSQLYVSHGVASLVIDTGNRPERKLKDLADALRAPYVAMPRADAQKLSRAISAAA